MAKLDLTPVLDLQPIEEEEQKPSTKAPARPIETPKSGPRRAIEAVPGAFQAITDLAGLMGGMVGSGSAAFGQMMDRITSRRQAVGKNLRTGEDIYPEEPKQKLGDKILGGWQDIVESAQNKNIANLVPGAEQTRKTPGYTASQEVLNAPAQGWGNISAAAAYAATGDNEFAADIGRRIEEGGDIASLMLLKGKGKAKIGTADWYRELHDSQKASRSQIQQSLQNQQSNARTDQIVQEQLAQHEARVAAEQQAKAMVDMDAQARDVGQLPDSNLRSPYRVDPTEQARLESELNPRGNQGDLFDPRPTTEIEGQTVPKFQIEEQGPGIRDKAQPPETVFEIGREAQSPTYTADMVNTASRSANLAVADPSIPFAEGLQKGSQAERRAMLLEEVNKERGPSFWESVTQVAEKAMENLSARGELNRGPGGRQRGYIDPNLLGAKAVDSIIQRERALDPVPERSAVNILTKFRGTYADHVLATAARLALPATSKRTVAIMDAADFHGLADPRKETAKAILEGSEAKRRSIRGGLMTEQGLLNMPKLQIFWNEKRKAWQVMFHNGRHRFDVAKERGLEKMPVQIEILDDHPGWGKKELPDRLLNQDGTAFFAMPDSLFFPRKDGGMGAPTVQYVPKSQRGHIGDWNERQVDKAVSKGKLAQTLIDMKRQLSVEKRPLKEVLKDIVPEQLKDLSWAGARLKGWTIDQTLVTNIADKNSALGKLAQWLVDHRDQNSRWRDRYATEKLEQMLPPFHWEFWKEGGLTGRAAKRHAHTQMNEMLGTWIDNVGKAKLERQNFRTDKQWQAYEHLRDYLDGLHKDINDFRQQMGKPPLPYLENYFPAIWQGDYRIWVKDQLGNDVGAYGFKNEWQAKLAHKTLQEAHPNLIIEKPSHKSLNKNKEQYNDFSAFEAAMRANSNNTPHAKALRETYAKMMKSRGMGAHGLWRQNMFGYLGFEKGDLGRHNAQLALELYTKRAANHIHNIKQTQLQIEWNRDLPAKIKEKIPRFAEWADDYLSIARGAEISKMDWIDRTIFEDASRAVGFGETGPRRFLQSTSSLFSLWKLFTAKFIAAQPMQVLQAAAKATQLHERLPTDTNSMSRSLVEGYRQAIMPDAYAKEAAEWAGKNEYMDAAVVQMLKLKTSDLRLDRGNVVMESGRKGLSAVEKHTVRLPLFLAFDHLLKPMFSDKIQRWEAAGKLLHYAVNYSRESRPINYEKMGLLGEATVSLKQYSHNFFGTFVEYAANAKNRHELRPLAHFMASQAFSAGLRGTIVAAEAAAIITLINKYFGTDWETPEEWLRRSMQSDIMANVPQGVKDAIVVGGPSAALGYDVSTSMNSPSIPGMFSVFPVEVGIDAAMATTKYLTRVVKGTATDQDEMAAAFAIFPSALHGWLEELYSKPGMPVPKPTQKMRGTYVREGQPLDLTSPSAYIPFAGERETAAVLGIKSIKETNNDAEQRIAKMLIARSIERRIDTIDVMVDRMMNKEQIEPYLFERYVKEGGNPQTLQQTLKDRYIQRSMTWEESQLYQMRKGMTPDKIKRLDAIKEFIDDPKNQSPEANPYIKNQSTGGIPSKEGVIPEDMIEWTSKQSPEIRALMYGMMKRKGIRPAMNVPPSRTFEPDPNLREQQRNQLQRMM